MATMVDPEIQGGRIFAYTKPYSWNQILGLFRKLYPGRQFADDLPDQGADLSTVANENSVEILKRMGK